MNCPTTEILFTQLEEGAAQNPVLQSHIDGCAECQSRIGELGAAVTGATELATALADEAPTSLEGRLRWRLAATGAATTTAAAGATTLRSDAGSHRGARAWFGRHRLALGSAAAAALVVVSFLLAGPTASVSASDVLERSRSALLGAWSDALGQRITYHVHYSGPDFGVLPEQQTEFVIEELWDRRGAGRVRITLTTADGTLLRGVSQTERERRMVAATPWGALAMTFDLTGATTEHDGAQGVTSQRMSLEQRRLHIAEAAFRMLMRAADPERLTSTETDGRYVVELGPPVASGENGMDGLFELSRGRVDIDTATYRLGSAQLAGFALGERFELDTRIVSIEGLGADALTAADFTLPAIDGAVELRADGTDHPLADMIRLLTSKVHLLAASTEPI